MTCESVEEVDATSTCCEDIDIDPEALMPWIIGATSLSTNDGNNELFSRPVFHTGDLVPVKREPLSMPISQPSLKPKKTSYTDCHVILKRLPERLVQSAECCKILVSDSSCAVFLKDSTELTHVFQIQGQTVKTEPVELDTADSEQAALPYLANQQHSATVIPTVLPASQLFSNHKTLQPQQASNNTVSRMTPVSAATSMSSHGQSAGIRSNAVDRDISVILLNTARLPRSSASAAANASALEQQDVSQLVLSMLQKQNINLAGNSTFSVVSAANEQRGTTGSAAHDAAKLREMLQNSDKAKMTLALKLNAEQAKVKYLQAEVSSLKKKLSKQQLSNNRAIVQGATHYATCGTFAAETAQMTVP